MGDDMMKVIVAALASGGIVSVLAAVINGIFSRKKLGADAAEAISRAAAGVVERLEAEVRRQETLILKMADDHRSQRAEWQQERIEVRNTLAAHVAWDGIAIQKMAEFGVTLPDPPPVPRVHDAS